MRYIPTKKSLKQGNTQVVQMKFCVHDMNKFIKKYECATIEDAWKFWLECQDSYIDLNLNYGYSISTIKVAEIYEYGAAEYRCRATLNKII
jgi:hypothetical protein